MSSVAENIIQHATHNSTLHQLAKDQPSVGVTTAFSILDTLKSMSYLKIFATLICILLVWDQVAYQIKKGSIAGPKFKFWPIIGPFLESLDPKFEEYKAKWASGPLSCVSISINLLLSHLLETWQERSCNLPNSSNLALSMLL